MLEPLTLSVITRERHSDYSGGIALAVKHRCYVDFSIGCSEIRLVATRRYCTAIALAFWEPHSVGPLPRMVARSRR